MKREQYEDVELGRLAAEIEAASILQQRYRRKDWWQAYAKQLAYFETGLRFRERALFAGTQLGKTECAAFEQSCHLTGDYPPEQRRHIWRVCIMAR